MVRDDLEGFCDGCCYRRSCDGDLFKCCYLKSSDGECLLRKDFDYIII